MNNFYVYLHRKKTDGKVFYVGKGSGKRAYYSNSRNNHWNYTVKKHGFYAEIIKDGLSERDALDLEIETIKQYGIDNLCNYTHGGDGMSGTKHTEEHKEYMREKMKGRKFSPETIEKMSAAATKRNKDPEFQKRRTKKLRGRKHSEDHKRKISEAVKGRVLSKEARKKISDFHKGKKKSPDAVRKMALTKAKPVYCVNNNTLYESSADASRKLGLSASKISECAIGKIKQTKGYIFKAVKNDKAKRLPAEDE